jgi:hypothetical protein
LIRAHRLVGDFMWHWSVLEGSLNIALHSLCGLSNIEGYAITSNMGVRDKIHTVKTMLNMFSGGDPERAKANMKLMEQIAALSTVRNVVAHTGFSGHPKGVMFFVVKAKGQFSVPDTVWTEKDFEERNSKMFAASEELRLAIPIAKEWRRRITGREMVPNIFAPPSMTQGQRLADLLTRAPPRQSHPDGGPPSHVKHPRSRKPPRVKKKAPETKS